MLANYIKEHGGGFYLNSRVTKIIDDGTKVSGLQVRNSAGEFTISAKAVNAEFSNNDVYKNGTIDFAPQLFITWNTVPDYSKTMLIDENGKRFSNEAPYNFLNLTTEMYKHGSEKYYLIYDGKKMDSSFKEKLDKVEENPQVYVHANSIVELANELKIDANSLKDTFVKYQNATETGKDEFGKDKTHLEKFTGNDFYAVYAMLGSWETINMKTKSGATKRAIKLHQFGRISNRR